MTKDKDDDYSLTQREWIVVTVYSILMFGVLALGIIWQSVVLIIMFAAMVLYAMRG